MLDVRMPGTLELVNHALRAAGDVVRAGAPPDLWIAFQTFWKCAPGSGAGSDGVSVALQTRGPADPGGVDISGNDRG